MIGVIDSKICNIFSLTNMLKKLGASFKTIQNGDEFTGIDKIILPGVGAFPKAMENLNKFGLVSPIMKFAAEGAPLLGICLGMQILFDESEEFGHSKGLGLIPGKVVKIKTDNVLPHMGWNDLIITGKNCKILENVSNNHCAYFVHSYRAETEESYICAYTEYGDKIPAVVNKDNIYGTQFHPEKSLICGEIILKNFINLKI
ncbi:MAG: imidazole glycerol phosphate synthase subunit HisH [Spirochaetes bacterium]|nr:imidazole glycerol phosphate synthase subunit HisH [Spirochaetota bacterium]